MAGAVPLPPGSRIAGLFAGADLADAYAIGLPPGSSRDIETLTRFLLAEPAPWVRALLGVRDAVVAGFGLKTSQELRKTSIGADDDRVDFFRVYAVARDEMTLGEDDKHLDFRLSVLRRSGDAGGDGKSEIVVTTVVHCHNLLGRLYLALITPFHRIVVKSYLRRAARRGWPASPVI